MTDLLNLRIDEHLTDKNSAVYKHNNIEHPNIDINNMFTFNVLFNNARSQKHLLYIESMYIKLNSGRLMNGVDGIYTNGHII